MDFAALTWDVKVHVMLDLCQHLGQEHVGLFFTYWDTAHNIH